MDWKKILSQSFDDWNDIKKDEIYEQLIILKREKIEKKNLKKFFDISQYLLKYKGEMVTSLLNDIEQHRFSTENIAFSEEIVELKKLLELADADKNKLKIKIKELTEENSILQQSHPRKSSNFGSGGEDSPDALSEIDRQEELLNNISAKNKHIKRLLRDIDVLEKQIVAQSHQINQLQSTLHEATTNLTLSTNHLDELKQQINNQSKEMTAIEMKNVELNSQIQLNDQANLARDMEIQTFGREIEQRAKMWKRCVEEKDERLESLRLKYDEILDKVPGYDIDEERTQITQMTEAIRERDAIIQDLETKLLDLSHELMTSTEMMNKLAREHEHTRDTTKSKLSSTSTCCLDAKQLLEHSTIRANELQEIVTTLEEDNRHKAKIAQEAIETLSAYQSGADGLAQTLKRNIDLQAKIRERDKQIRAFVVELNGLQEIGQENCVLRKRLGIDDDEFVSTKTYTARQRKFEKLNEKLTLKLRASEEIRLQLKLEKNDLRRQIHELSDAENRLRKETNTEKESLTIIDEEEQQSNDIKFCENCLKQYNVIIAEESHQTNICPNCKLKSTATATDNNHYQIQIQEFEEKYEIVVEENENLRIGMHEILKKLRDYDAESNNIIIDSTMLQQVLHALDARSISGWYHPAMRLQNELIAAKERENSLKERLRCIEQVLQNSGKIFNETDNELIDDEATIDDVNSRKSIHCENFSEFYTDYIAMTTNEIDDLRTKLKETVEQLHAYEMKTIEIDVIRKEMKDLVDNLQSSEDEKELVLARQHEEIIKLRTDFIIEQKKVHYLHDDCKLLHRQSKHDKELANRIQFELQKELIEIKQNSHHLTVDNKSLKSVLNSDDNTDAENDLIRLSRQLSKFTAIFIKHLPSIDMENVLKNELSSSLFENVAIIDDNDLAIEFITKSDLQQLNENNLKLKHQHQQLLTENQHLIELLTIHREQIKSQQLLLTQSSDNDVTLRHLIVDLQCENNDKFLIAKSTRELQELKLQHSHIITDNEQLRNKIVKLEQNLETCQRENEEIIKQFEKINCSNEIKLKFLHKSLLQLKVNYSAVMPLYPIADFIMDCSTILELTKLSNNSNQQRMIEMCRNEFDKLIQLYQAEHLHEQSTIEDRIQLLKSQSNCKIVEQQLCAATEQIDALQVTVQQYRVNEMTWTQHWKTIEMLFSEEPKPPTEIVDDDIETQESAVQVHRETQTIIETTDKCINTDDPISNEFTQVSSVQQQPATTTSSSFIDMNAHKSMESQLKQAMILASTRSALLLETENRLAIAQGRIKALERTIDERESKWKADEREQNNLKLFAASSSSPRKDDCVLSATITSLQHLLQEKDSTLLRYQELVRAECVDRTKLYDDHRQETRMLQEKIDSTEIKIKTKDRQIEQLKDKLREHDLLATNAGGSVVGSQAVLTATAVVDGKLKSTANNAAVDYSQLSDKNIEEMFLSERSSVVFDIVDPDIETNDLRQRIKERDDDVRKLQQKLRDVSNREKMWEKSLSDKDREIDALNEKLQASQMEFKDISEGISTRREIEQLREMLEEKDRHINDLTDTLTHFHDDQQRFITDTSLHSAEQVSQLSSDLSRSEATNRILNTQLDALKRQIANVCQREKQARDLVKTLKTQLIKRPVISVKAERTAAVSSREDNLQKRIHQLENEILITKEELRKQTNFVQTRRTKDANELALWDKQKRFQQLSENLKQKLSERDNELEKLRGHFATAKTTIARLEREKHLLENRLRSSGTSTRYCSSPSCPNLHVIGGTKYTTAESPESYMTTQSEFCGGGGGGGGGGGDGDDDGTASSSLAIAKRLNISDTNKEIIDALKGRIESQQRKIIAFELEGKGNQAMTNEIEKLHEKLSNCEAQNLRLEAKNLQLQLDNDILRQGDKDERNRRQIKHLEDYINALKNELSQALSVKESTSLITGQSSSSSTKSISAGTGQMEQTILSLRNIIERLKVENKNLKDGKKMSFITKSNISKEMYDKLRNEFEKLQQMYSDSLDKMSALQIELEIQNITCANCKGRMEKHQQNDQMNAGDSQTIGLNNDLVNELKSIKEKLIQKSQLLEKAKILLTRAAAKERNFREQIVYWKRKCSELQNVPVIDEASE